MMAFAFGFLLMLARSIFNYISGHANDHIEDREAYLRRRKDIELTVNEDKIEKYSEYDKKDYIPSSARSANTNRRMIHPELDYTD